MEFPIVIRVGLYRVDLPPIRVTSMKKVSVIIPIYNCGEYLEKCIQSVRNNTYTGLEIICVNDGSTDRSADILRRLQKEDSRIIVLEQENKGPSAARNTGLKTATGEYIAFVDADDLVHERYFELLANELESSKADIVICDFMRVSDVNTPFPGIEDISFYDYPFGNVFSQTVGKYYVWGRLYKRELIKNISFHEDVLFSEDILFNAEIMLNNPELTIRKSDIGLYAYNNRPDSLVHSENFDRKFGFIQAYYELVEAKGEGNPFYTDHMAEIIKNCLSTRYKNMFHPEHALRKRKLDGIIKTCLPKLKRAPAARRAVLRLFYSFPQAYRLFRIAKDRTLLAWEAEMKNNYKALTDEA